MGIDTCDKNGETALFVAVRNGDLEMAEYLLKKGINTFIFNNKNRSADFVAMEYFVDFDNQVSDDLSVIPSALLDKEYYSSLERRYKILSLIREHQKRQFRYGSIYSLRL
jgi:ankyrin repeat protein